MAYASAMKYHVILVEDDIDMQAYIAYCLSTEGLNVLVACNGQHALELLASLDPGEIPPVAIVDIMMPILDGFGFARELELETFGEMMTLIFFTSMMQKPQVTFREKSCLVLSKPGDINKLLDRICQIIGTQKNSIVSHCGTSTELP